MATIPPVIGHVESHFGSIDSGAGYWRFPLGGYWLQAVTFRDRPRVGAITLCTLGFWHHELWSPTGPVRQELVLACAGPFAKEGERLACIFPSVGEAILSAGVALATGQVFGPMGPVIAEVSPMEWLLCLPPRLFPPSFSVCEGTKPATQFTWLVPISTEEAGEVRGGNLAELERRWERDGVDLLHWRRNG